MTDNKINCNMFFWNKNFGDCLGPYIFNKITGHNAILTSPKKKISSPIYFTIGSRLKPPHCKSNVIVWGSGIINSTDIFEKPLSIKSVRGPLTYRRCIELGYDCPKIFGDPALLLPKFYKSNMTKKYKIGLIPHYVDYDHIIKLYQNNKEIKIIKFSMNDYNAKVIENIIDQINECEYTISSSLHGIIVSHAYDIKSRWVKYLQELDGDDVKFLDYFYSQGITDKIQTTKLDLTNKIMTVDELINIVENTELPSNKIDLEVLLKVCPFNI